MSFESDSEIEVKHKDVLIRLRSMIEEDLASSTEAMGERPQAESGDSERHAA